MWSVTLLKNLALIYIGDGRFHLESAMIQNPKVPAYKYDPYSRILTTEQYGFDLMLKTRHDAIRIARNSTNFGLILGTLGRQGNFKLYKVCLLLSTYVMLKCVPTFRLFNFYKLNL